MLHERITAAMRARGLNKSELAELSGLSQPMITYITTGQTRDPGISKVVAITKALNVPIDVLIDESVVPDDELEEYVRTEYAVVEVPNE